MADPPKPRVCAECFGPRSIYSTNWFCAGCERRLFGPGRGVWRFLHAERSRNGRQWGTRR